jgi:hypothetical protein
LRNDLSQGTDTDLLVVRHDDSACRLGTAQDHVASFLPAKLELTSLERRPHILAAHIREYEDSPVNGMSASIAPA